ncbi:type III pantothenate kinase [Burkholderia gladioli]|uniref:type III pantothenate kinase n=1 Tax=Burkholderia gladioli TaxID=28095 RepID=UPI001364B1FB|nr:type III pantothenate kinase [Burkholderia gladioli]KAF1063306.1 Type III pantothenate kinase [Burkholderia gladioli]WAG19534.1 type III pantothenate kinase [Burkholderia gladioli]
MSELALLVDAGNSRIKWALADAGGQLVESAAFDHGADHAAAAIPAWPGRPAPRGAWISNVAGADVAARIEALVEARWPGLPRRIVTARAAQCGVSNGYGQPSQLGSDRWCGLIGARAAFPGEALLIATFGTATTLESLEADGRFVGGLIAPGWALMMRSLGTHTAQLPTLTTDTARRLVDELDQTAGRIPFATDTAHSLSAGCLQAQAGLVERAWRERSAEDTRPVRLVLSGGAADAVAQVLTVPYTRHDTLVLSGLARIAQDAAQD